MTTARIGPSDRIKAAVIAVTIEALLGFLLVSALGYHVVRLPTENLKLFGVPVPPPPPPPNHIPQPRSARQRLKAAAAPPNLRAKATPVVAPTPIIPPPTPPPPVTVAPVAEQGPAPSAGAADRRGPGTGAGGEGNGFGGGGRGNGDGGGSGQEMPPRRIGGRLTIHDLPPDLAEEGGGTVGVRYTVETDGRVSTCRVTRSSGLRDLDDLTCRLIQERFRYRPALDGDGRPVRSELVEDHYWDVHNDGGR